MKNKALDIWLGALIRGVVVFGITGFSTAMGMGFTLELLRVASIAGGLYMFAELVKYYKISLPTRTKKCYCFLLFP